MDSKLLWYAECMAISGKLFAQNERAFQTELASRRPSITAYSGSAKDVDRFRAFAGLTAGYWLPKSGIRTKASVA